MAGSNSAWRYSGQAQVTGLTIATQIAAGGASSFAVRTVAYLLGSEPRGRGLAA